MNHPKSNYRGIRRYTVERPRHAYESGDVRRPVIEYRTDSRTKAEAVAYVYPEGWIVDHRASAVSAPSQGQAGCRYCANDQDANIKASDPEDVRRAKRAAIIAHREH